MTTAAPHETSRSDRQPDAAESPGERGGTRTSYTMTEAARRLGVTEKTLRRWIGMVDEVVPEPSALDRREKRLSAGEVERLAQLFATPAASHEAPKAATRLARTLNGLLRWKKRTERVLDEHENAIRRLPELEAAVRRCGELEQRVRDLERTLAAAPRGLDAASTPITRSVGETARR